MTVEPDKLRSSGAEDERLGQALEFLEKLITTHRDLDTPPELSAVSGFDSFCAYLRDLKAALFLFAKGQFGQRLTRGGASMGYVKSLQSAIRHLAWQCRRVADGDLKQRLDFMGELSEAFNLMAESLAEQRLLVSRKQDELADLTQELRKEIKRKEEIEAALRTSEEIYRHKALHDPLTGIYNRGYFFETVTREIENLKRQPGRQSCLLMIDIDNFKKYNDAYGHLLGDRALKTVAEAVAGSLRKSDILARYGGEEFVVYLDGADLETGLSIAERIRFLVASQPNPAGPNEEPITISLGLCGLESRLLSPYSPGPNVVLEALAQADSALYLAKESGRNQVKRAPGLRAEAAASDDDDDPSDELAIG